jgi:hypothetical protein
MARSTRKSLFSRIFGSLGKKPNVRVVKLESQPDGSIVSEKPISSRTSREISEYERLPESFFRRIEKTKAIYLLEWRGDKIPRGAIVSKKIITWTEKGIVSSKNIYQIGIYHRLVEFGGIDGDQQKMIVVMS